MAAKRPFNMHYKTYEGDRGTPDQWRAAFHATMGADEAKAHVGTDTPEHILGVSVGSVWSAIVSAYRAGVLATHPDRCAFHKLTVADATEKFKRVLAAYTVLKARYGR